MQTLLTPLLEILGKKMGRSELTAEGDAEVVPRYRADGWYY